MTGLAAALRDWLASGQPAALVRVERARGSTPREEGVAMLVTADAIAGTIGGGQLELDAIARARALLAGGDAEAVVEIPLGPAIGQCCGGHVRLRIARADDAAVDALAAAEAAAEAAAPMVLVFGAGHVGHALIDALALLPFRVRWIDDRADAFGAVPAGIARIVAPDPEAEVASAPAGAACVVLTHSHALDARITAAALERDGLAYVGLIGSATKRRRFEHGFRDIGIAERRIARLVCPIGDRGVRDKRPAVIAALVAAELVAAFAAAAARHDAERAA